MIERGNYFDTMSRMRGHTRRGFHSRLHKTLTLKHEDAQHSVRRNAPEYWKGFALTNRQATSNAHVRKKTPIETTCCGTAPTQEREA